MTPHLHLVDAASDVRLHRGAVEQAGKGVLAGSLQQLVQPLLQAVIKHLS